MAFFKKKTPVKEEAPKRSLQEVVHERVLTAEGWRRRALKKAQPQKKK